MGISRTRLGVMMAVACFCFGCKGAGGAFKVATVGLAGLRVAAAIAQAVPSQGGEGGGEAPVQAPPPPPPQPAMASVHLRCVELVPAPELPGDVVVVRTVTCGGRVMVQDARTGMWRDHR